MRAVLGGPIPRLVLFGFVLLGIQNTVLANHPVGDVRIQILLALAAAAGAGAGAERGALAGFVMGMMYDLSSGQPLGLTALAYGLAGLVAGYLQVIKPVPRWWMLGGFAALGAAAGEASLPVLMAMTGQGGWVGFRLLRVIPVVAVAAVVLAPVFVPVGRWLVGFRPPQWKVMQE